MLPSPKIRFLSDKSAVKAHIDLVDQAAFSSGMEVALLQLVWECRTAKGIEQSAVANHALQGAQRFIEIFTTLCDPPTKVPEPPPQNLDWTVR